MDRRFFLLVLGQSVLIACEELQFIDVFGYVREREFHVESLLRGTKSHQTQPLEIAGENVAGLLSRANCAAKEAIAGLIDRYLQVYTGLFRLPNDHTRPK